MSALMSVLPRYATGLLAGTKTVEVRRRTARLPVGSACLLYASGQTRALLGATVVRSVHSDDPQRLWTRWGSHTGLERREFDSYLEGAAAPCMIEMMPAVTLADPVSLGALRTRWPGFRPPQSYRYLDNAETASLFGIETGLDRLLAGKRNTVPDRRS